MRKHKTTLSEQLALARMREGSVLVRMHGTDKGQWFVVPGGAVTAETARCIRQHPAVIGGKDGLFPEHDQTWRMRSFVEMAATRITKPAT